MDYQPVQVVGFILCYFTKRHVTWFGHEAFTVGPTDRTVKEPCKYNVIFEVQSENRVSGNLMKWMMTPNIFEIMMALSRWHSVRVKIISVPLILLTVSNFNNTSRGATFSKWVLAVRVGTYTAFIYRCFTHAWVPERWWWSGRMFGSFGSTKVFSTTCIRAYMDRKQKSFWLNSYRER